MSPPTNSVFEGCDPTQVAMLERSYLAAWAIVRPNNMKSRFHAGKRIAGRTCWVHSEARR